MRRRPVIGAPAPAALATALLPVILALAGIAAPAAAQTEAGLDLAGELEARFDREVERLAARVRARALPLADRAVAAGPHLAAAGAFETQTRDADLHISAGVSLTRHAMPLLTFPDRIDERVRAMALERLVERLSAARSPDRAAFERALAETMEAVERELLAELEPRRLGRPDRELSLEAGALVGAGVWELRATAGYGAVGVIASSGLVALYDDGFSLALPVELAVPIFVTRGLRSPVVELFGRIDIALFDRGDRPDRFGLGARVLLDLL